MSDPIDPFVDDDELFRYIRIADSAREFFTSHPVGQVLLDNAKTAIRDALLKFLRLTENEILEHPGMVLATYSEAHRSLALLRLVSEAVSKGEWAEAELRLRDEAEEAID